MGFCTVKDGVNAGNQLSEEESTRAKLPSLKETGNRRCCCWEYLPEGSRDDCPDFRGYNDAYYKLFDDNYFTFFINSCVYRIEEVWREYKRKVSEHEAL